MIFGLPKLYGYAAIALAVLLAVGAIYGKGRADGKQVIQAVLDAQRVTWQQQYNRQAAETAAKEAAWAATSKEIEDGLQATLADVTTRADDLAGRLRDYRARRCAVSASPGSAAVTDSASGVPGSDASIERRTGEVFAACARDSARLSEWQGFYENLRTVHSNSMMTTRSSILAGSR
jgi:hypothetical protein